MKLWQKKYALNKTIEDFTVGNDFVLDLQLIEYDCIGSMAHAQMLGKIGVLKSAEVKKLVKELKKIIELNKKGKFRIKKEQEDCHTAIENYLTKKLGNLGKKIHTGRSRNDQVQTALRLYSKAELNQTIEKVELLIQSLEKFSKKYKQVNFPGYTHMRKAMPSSISSWSNGFTASLKDDIQILKTALKLVDQNPLGSAAGYGSPLTLDRAFTAKLLKFSKIQELTYVQNSRGKFEAFILSALMQVLLDLNKMASDIILFSMFEFSYFELPNEICSGSSLMPHKKNPDVLELIRGNLSVVQGNLIQVLSLIQSLPSGYNRDFQLTKEPFLNGFQVTQKSVNAMIVVMTKLKVNEFKCRQALTEELYATEQALKLVNEGKTFRDAYNEIGKKFA
ncbi:MAG: argininosuccinate lyase [Candidatus Diapherotrites archaeon]|nr:argininosuccinate lyase [Candidatus Diapherotrites archaeon]